MGRLKDPPKFQPCSAGHFPVPLPRANPYGCSQGHVCRYAIGLGDACLLCSMPITGNAHPSMFGCKDNLKFIRPFTFNRDTRYHRYWPGAYKCAVGGQRTSRALKTILRHSGERRNSVFSGLSYSYGKIPDLDFHRSDAAKKFLPQRGELELNSVRTILLGPGRLLPSRRQWP